MQISYTLPRARCTCWKLQNKTEQNRVPPNRQVGLFQRKAEGSQRRILPVVPRGGVPQPSDYKGLRRQTGARGSFDPQRLSGALANRGPTQIMQHAGRALFVIFFRDPRSILSPPARLSNLQSCHTVA